MSTLESDYGDNTTGSMYGSYCFIPDNECSKGSSPNCGSVRETKWWLNDQGRRWGYFQDQLNMLDSEVKILGDNFANRNVKGSRANQLIEEFYTVYPTTDPALSSDVQLKKWHFKCKGNEDGAFQEFEPASNDNILLDAHLRESESCNSLIFEQQKKHTPDFDSHWIGLKKFEPWWHAGDKEVSAALVSETSSYRRMRNYDHTSIRFMHAKKDSDNCVNCFDQFKQQMTNKEAKLPYVADTMRVNLSSVDETEISYLADCSSETLASISTAESLCKQGLTECILQASNGSFRSDSLNAVKAYPSRPSQPPSEELSRAQLLEALCHSQTRAREAEKFAQKTCDEKDHVINLFFQQASYLFAYRQWLRLLQLEMLCLHLRRRDELSSCANAVVSPWLQHSSTTQRKNRRTTKNKPVEECWFCQYAIFFAVGFTLAGAGFLVGWTIGWLLPAFWRG